MYCEKIAPQKSIAVYVCMHTGIYFSSHNYVSQQSFACLCYAKKKKKPCVFYSYSEQLQFIEMK